MSEAYSQPTLEIIAATNTEFKNLTIASMEPGEPYSQGDHKILAGLFGMLAGDSCPFPLDGPARYMYNFRRVGLAEVDDPYSTAPSYTLTKRGEEVQASVGLALDLSLGVEQSLIDLYGAGTIARPGKIHFTRRFGLYQLLRDGDGRSVPVRDIAKDFEISPAETRGLVRRLAKAGIADDEDGEAVSANNDQLVIISGVLNIADSIEKPNPTQRSLGHQKLQAILEHPAAVKLLIQKTVSPSQHD